MTVVVDPTTAPLAGPDSHSDGLASWRARAGAFVVDTVPGVGAVYTMALISLALPAGSSLWWISFISAAVACLAVLANRLVLPALTGWSLGRALFGITVTLDDGGRPGPWRLLLRDCTHLLDTVPVFVGWLWPLWDGRRRTFADLSVHTEVRRSRPSESPLTLRRWVAQGCLAAGLSCLIGAGLGCAVVYAPERATERARQQISIQGPQIVERILSYDPATLQDDFARALSLTSPAYRGNLAAQQEHVKKGVPVLNEYHLIGGAVQNAAPDRATMLMFLQGRRGQGQDQRYISATVRVRFIRDRDHWLVDDLAVVTKPKPAGDPK